MIISEVLDAIDNVNSITLESEIDTCESLLNSYDKMLIIEENYNGNDINDFKIFQEGFGDDVKGEMKESGKNMGTLMKILTALPRFIIAIVKSIKNRLSKKTKDTAKEINDNVKKLSDEQKKGLAQLFPKDRKGKIDAKKIIRGMIGGVAVVGGAIAIGKFKIPKKLAEQTKHVLGKLKGKKSNNPKPANKKIQNNAVDETYGFGDKELYDKVSNKLKEFIKISGDDIKVIIDSYSVLDTLKSSDDGCYIESDEFRKVITDIKKKNKNINEIFKTEEAEQLMTNFSDNWKKYNTYQIDDKADIIAGNILAIISYHTYDKKDEAYQQNPSKQANPAEEKDKIENSCDLYNEINNKLNEIKKTFDHHKKDTREKLSSENYSSTFYLYYLYGGYIYVNARIYNKCFRKFVRAKYYLEHKYMSYEYTEEIAKLEEKQKEIFNIKEIDYETKGGEFNDALIDTFVSELNSYIKKTLDPSKINQQIDDIKKACNSINKDTCNVEMVTSYLKDAKNEILYIFDIINKIGEIIIEVNEFIKSINEINGTNIVTTDKKLERLDVSAIRDID